MLTECDTCGEWIESAEEAYFEWREIRDDISNIYQTDFAIVHFYPFSPVGNCYADRFGKFIEGYMSLPFRSLLRADHHFLTFNMTGVVQHIRMAPTPEWNEFRERFRLLRFTTNPPASSPWGREMRIEYGDLT